ncbi:MAG TPA: hypothetical protein VFU89_07110 [Rhabdochlamydiaceae bacterium]|nr:hypothetical protein [Rhabdochlamydiaceae bacterium]
MAQQVPPLSISALGLTVFKPPTSEGPSSPSTLKSTISSALDSPPLPPPPPLDSELTIPSAVQPATSLTSEAQLSRTRFILDQTSQAFWWIASLPGRAMKATLDKGTTIATGVILRTAAQKGVSLAAPPALETPLKGLRDCLFELLQKINGNIPVDDRLRKRTIDALILFLKDPETFLTDCYHPAALYFPEKLNQQQLANFTALLNALKENQSLANEGNFLDPLCKFLENCCQYLYCHQ